MQLHATASSDGVHDGRDVRLHLVNGHDGSPRPAPRMVRASGGAWSRRLTAG
jgi:hypothetical protein